MCNNYVIGSTTMVSAKEMFVIFLLKSIVLIWESNIPAAGREHDPMTFHNFLVSWREGDVDKALVWPEPLKDAGNVLVVVVPLQAVLLTSGQFGILKCKIENVQLVHKYLKIYWATVLNKVEYFL